MMTIRHSQLTLAGALLLLGACSSATKDRTNPKPEKSPAQNEGHPPGPSDQMLVDDEFVPFQTTKSFISLPSSDDNCDLPDPADSNSSYVDLELTGPATYDIDITTKSRWRQGCRLDFFSVGISAAGWCGAGENALQKVVTYTITSSEVTLRISHWHQRDGQRAWTKNGFILQEGDLANGLVLRSEDGADGDANDLFVTIKRR